MTCARFLDVEQEMSTSEEKLLCDNDPMKAARKENHHGNRSWGDKGQAGFQIASTVEKHLN